MNTSKAFAELERQVQEDQNKQFLQINNLQRSLTIAYKVRVLLENGVKRNEDPAKLIADAIKLLEPITATGN